MMTDIQAFFEYVNRVVELEFLGFLGLVEAEHNSF